MGCRRPGWSRAPTVRIPHARFYCLDTHHRRQVHLRSRRPDDLQWPRGSVSGTHESNFQSHPTAHHAGRPRQVLRRRPTVDVAFRQIAALHTRWSTAFWLLTESSRSSLRPRSQTNGASSYGATRGQPFAPTQKRFGVKTWFG